MAFTLYLGLEFSAVALFLCLAREKNGFFVYLA